MPLLLGSSEWQFDLVIPYSDGYADFVNQATDQCACYNPHSQALNIYSKNFCYDEGNDTYAFLEFHTLPPDGEEQRPSRVVCIHHDRAWSWARVAVFSSHTMEWQVVLPEMDTGGLLVEGYRFATGTVVSGFVCWVHTAGGCILALNTTTFQYSLMDLPPPLKMPSSRFQLGQTRDGEICVVSVLQCMLYVWLWAAGGDGVERFMLHKMFSFRAYVSEFIEEADVMMRPMPVINGFVYLSLTVVYSRDYVPPEWFLSFCLETDEVNLHHRESRRIPCPVDPYIMVRWPSSLIHGKEDLETEVTGNISEDDDPICTEEACPVLFTALQSFKEKLINDGNLNFAEIDSFLLDDERKSLMNRIATLESGLAAARERVLRICTEPNSMEGIKFVTSEAGLEVMERLSCWQICKVMLGRACSGVCRFFTR